MLSRMEVRKLPTVGYFANADGSCYEWETDYPVAANTVDETWDQDERSFVAAYLRAGRRALQCRGSSLCRFCQCKNGSGDFTDESYLWPEGYAHYLEEHGVKPPQDFIDHVLSTRTAN